MKTTNLITVLEVTGSALAIIYALLIASNTGNEIVGFTLLLISAALFAGWGFLDKRWAFFLFSFSTRPQPLLALFAGRSMKWMSEMAKVGGRCLSRIWTYQEYAPFGDPLTESD